MTLVAAAWIGTNAGGGSTTKWFDDLITAAAAASASIGCLFASKHHSTSELRFWRLLGGACAAWTVAEVIWAFYDLRPGGAVPVPSWADVGYLGAIPLAVLALLSHPALNPSAVNRVRISLDATIIATAIVLISCTLVLGPVARKIDLGTVAGIVTLAYPLGDVVLSVLVISILRARHMRGHLELYWVLGGLFAMTLSDSTYAVLTQTAGYTSGHILDVGWIAAYLAIAVGALQARAVEGVGADNGAQGIVGTLWPMLVTLGALASILLDAQLRHRIPPEDWWLGLLLVTLVLAREAVRLRISLLRHVAVPLLRSGTGDEHA